LVISELFTNAIRHAPGPCGVILEWSATELSLTVWDTSCEQPVVRPPDPRRIGGHGLHLVHGISDHWAIAPHPAGKQVTARIRLPWTLSPAPGPSPDAKVF
jgi:anti-sigma regulatory factor (Ser/Thr protein kinase)